MNKRRKLGENAWAFSARCAYVWANAFVLAACGAPTVPQPPVSPHLSDSATPVTHPPPAALPEIVPAQPDPKAVWVDGHWIWQGKEWFWKRGGWVHVPAGARLTDWHAWYEGDGTLLFTDSHWLDADRHVIDDPPFLRPAASPPTPLVSEEATPP